MSGLDDHGRASPEVDGESHTILASDQAKWAPPEADDGSRSGLTWIIIAAAGAAIAFLLLCVALMIGAFWIVRPGEQIDTEQIAGVGTTVILHAVDDTDGPGLSDFLGRVMIEIERSTKDEERQDFFESLGWLRELQLRQNAAALDPFMPRELTITLEQWAADRDDRVLWAANPRGYTKLLRLLIESVASENVRKSTWRDHELYHFPDGTTFTLVGGTLLGGGGPDIVYMAIDRVEAAAGSGGGRETSLMRMHRQRDPEWAFHFVAERDSTLLDHQLFRSLLLLDTNRADGSGGADGAEGAIVAEPSLDVLLGPDGLSALVVAGDFLDDQTIVAEIQALTNSEEAATAWERHFRERWSEGLRAALRPHVPEEPEGPALEVEVERLGHLALAKVRVPRAATTLASVLSGQR